MSPKIFYCISSLGAGPYAINPSNTLEKTAEGAGQDFLDEHAGYQYDWPLTIELIGNEGTILGSFEVDLEHITQCVARRIP